MIAYSSRCLAALCLMLAWCGQGAPASAPPVRVVVSFSILDDIVRRIGGSEVVVTSLIGPDSDAHLFEPNPDQARLLAKAQLFVVNGLSDDMTVINVASAKAVKTIPVGRVPHTVVVVD